MEGVGQKTKQIHPLSTKQSREGLKGSSQTKHGGTGLSEAQGIRVVSMSFGA